MKESGNVKVWLTLPESSLEMIQEVIDKNGAGIIGNYSHCSFVTEGHGFFKPMDGANPTVGEVGKIQKEKEYSIQFLCKKSLVKKLVEEIKKVHPYEEVAIDIFPLLEI